MRRIKGTDRKETEGLKIADWWPCDVTSVGCLSLIADMGGSGVARSITFVYSVCVWIPTTIPCRKKE